jgi:hypothetical protein
MEAIHRRPVTPDILRAIAESTEKMSQEIEAASKERQ